MFLRPGSVPEACDALAAGPAVLLAGGTDVFPGLVDRPDPPRVIDLSLVAEMIGIAGEADHIRIGARTTWSAIARADLPPAFDALRAAAREVGSVQIQNAASIAGNLCNASPAADGVPPLLILDASVELASAAGGRRTMTLDAFLLGNRRTERRPDEIMTAILVPNPAPGARSRFVKLGARRYLVISVAMCAAMLDVDPSGSIADAQVAVGSCAATAKRLPGLEAALRGVAARPGLGAHIEAAHLEPLSPIDDVRATASYRLDAAREIVGRALDGCLKRAAA